MIDADSPNCRLELGCRHFQLFTFYFPLPLSCFLLFTFNSLAAGQPPRASIPVLTLEQFGRAVEIAKLAAENDLHELSLRAVREALRPGPPTPTPAGVRGGPGLGGAMMAPRRIVRQGQPGDDSVAFAQIEQRVAELERLWRQHGAPAQRVYETIVEVVLPESRPAEIFIYPRPLQGLNEPRSVGRMLARWAVDAGRVDDLKRRIEARQEQPLAQLPARVLLAQLCAAQGDAEGVAEGLAWFAERLKTDGLANSAELAFHAVPAVMLIEQSSAALSLLEIVAKGMAKQVEQGVNTENFGQLMLALARARFKQGDVDAGNKHLQEFLATHERQNARYSGDYGVHLRKRQLHQVALEFAEAGQFDATMRVLGQYVDAPRTRQGDPPLGDLMGLVARMLKQLPADERYTRLKQWTLPAEGRRFVRVLAGFVPTDSLWGIEQSASADVANSVTLLLDAAREAGRLEELAAEAKAAATEPGTENAQVVYLMVEVARGQVARGQVARGKEGAAIETELRTLTDERRKALPNHNDLSHPYAWVDYLLARALSADHRLRPLGEDLTRTLVSHGQRVVDFLFVAHCRSDVWACQAAAEPETGLTRGQDPGLSFWHPATHQTAATYRAGATPAWWVAHEGHITHIAGPQNDFLYFDYPLTGEFEFSVDAYEIHWEEPNISFGGLVFETIHLGQKTQIWPVGQNESLGVSDPLEIPWAFNRLTVRVEPGRNRYYCNGHLVYEDADPSPTSPWLALFSHQYGQTCYRNFAWKGEPQIPREVPLTHGDRMEGWIATFYGETQPPRRTVGRPDNNGRAAATFDSDPNAYDWRAADGVLHGRRRTGDGRPAPAESWLYYHRPLRSGESVRYEFFYEPERYEVCPTIGGLAFVLNADGVRLHQLTDGTDRPTGGLVRDNLSDEPAHRRGPQRLPLNARDWNDVTLALAGDVLTLSLNGVEVYQRPLEEANERFFGLYHDKDRTAAQVRNVVLSGDWPQSLSVEELADSTQLAGGPESDARRRVKHAMLGEDKLAQNAGNVWLRARHLPSAERYALLREWVLPNPDHPTFRLRGEFTPVDPAPPVAAIWDPDAAAPAAKNAAQPAAKNAAQPAATPTRSASKAQRSNTAPTDRHAQVGGKLVAPAMELVNVADELGQIDELERDVSQVVVSGDLDRRGQLALLLLIALARGDETRAEACLGELCSLVVRAAANAPEFQYWPEFVAATTALERPALRRTARALVEFMVQQNIHSYGAPGWLAHVTHLRGKARWLAREEEQRRPFGSELPLSQWRAVTYARAETRGRGYPASHWRSEGGRLEHVPGHGRDVAYFAVPLAGDFQVDAQLTGFGWREVELVYDDLREVLRTDLKHLGQSKVGWSLADVEVVPPLEPIGLWFDYRLVVRDGIATSFIGGRKVHERRLTANPDPWLALSCEGNYEGVARNVRITGQPMVPDVLELSAGHDLSGWRADYYGEVLTGEGLPGGGPAWRKQGDSIVGVKLPDIEGSLRESLLQYHRPLLEDGVLEYEFLYQPGRAAVHPAIDRLALMIEADGVRVHWLTDAQFDRTGLTPDNMAIEADNRRGAAALPLRSNEWNHVRLALAGDELTLRLNGVDIYRRRLEPSNRRFFGLFHYADQTEALVRRLTYRGEWPKVPPALDEQELAVDPLRAARFEPNALPERFEWDFRGRPVDPSLFAPDFPFVLADPAKVFFPVPDGLRIALTADQDKTNCAGYKTLFGVRGDFEIELEFTSLAVKPPAAGAEWGSGIELRLQFDETQDQHLARRCLQPDGSQQLLTCNARRCPGGADDWQFFHNTLECSSGRFKFVRKGTVLYYLFAAGDGELVLYDERIVGRSDVKSCQIFALAFDRQSGADVVLERLSVRAAKLSGK